MDTRTGKVYDSVEEALRAGAKPEDVVELLGSPKAVRRVHRAVSANVRRAKLRAKRQRQIQRASRKRNR